MPGCGPLIAVVTRRVNLLHVLGGRTAPPRDPRSRLRHGEGYEWTTGRAARRAPRKKRAGPVHAGDVTLRRYLRPKVDRPSQQGTVLGLEALGCRFRLRSGLGCRGGRRPVVPASTRTFGRHPPPGSETSHRRRDIAGDELLPGVRDIRMIRDNGGVVWGGGPRESMASRGPAAVAIGRAAARSGFRGSTRLRRRPPRKVIARRTTWGSGIRSSPNTYSSPQDCPNEPSVGLRASPEKQLAGRTRPHMSSCAVVERGEKGLPRGVLDARVRDPGPGPIAPRSRVRGLTAGLGISSAGSGMGVVGRLLANHRLAARPTPTGRRSELARAPAAVYAALELRRPHNPGSARTEAAGHRGSHDWTRRPAGGRMRARASWGEGFAAISQREGSPVGSQLDHRPQPWAPAARRAPRGPAGRPRRKSDRPCLGIVREFLTGSSRATSSGP